MYDGEYIPVTGYAQIDGLGRLDISAFDARFEINSIPVATINLALGTAESHSTRSSAQLRRALQTRRRVEVYVSAEPGGSTELVFRGYTAGLSMVRDGSTAGLQVGLIHFLSDLHTSSALTEGLTPAAMSDLNLPLVTTSGSAGGVNYYGTLLGVAAVVSRNVGNDLTDIGGAVRGALELFTGSRGLKDSEFDNELARDIIQNRIRTLASFGFDRPNAVDFGITKYITAPLRQLYSGASLWQALLQISRMFSLVVIPRIEDVVIAPFNPSLSIASMGSAALISGDQYTYASLNQIIKPPLRGIRLYAGHKPSDTGVYAGGRPRPVALFTRDGFPTGMIDSASVPPWLLTEFSQLAFNASYRPGVRGRASPSEEASAAQSTEFTERATSAEFGNIGTRLAQAILYERMFSRMTCTVTGPYRLDIAPGSLVRLSIPGQRPAIRKVSFSSSSTRDDVIGGYVTGVNIKVDAARPAVLQSFTIKYCRGSADDSSAPENHPLYAQRLQRLGLTNTNPVT